MSLDSEREVGLRVRAEHAIVNGEFIPFGPGDILDCLDEVSSLRKALAEAKTVLEAWQTVFGTTQLTHAKDRLDAAEKLVEQAKRGLSLIEEELALEIKRLGH